MKIIIQHIAAAFAVAISTQVCSASLPAPLPEFKSKAELQQIAQARQATAATKSATENGAFYTGKPYDADSGGYLFKYRNYDPEMIRWTTVDPSGFPDGVNNNRYSPVPTDQLDCQGLATHDVSQVFTTTLAQGTIWSSDAKTELSAVLHAS